MINVAVSLSKNGEIYVVDAMSVTNDDGKNEYFPITRAVSGDRDAVVKKALKPVRRYLREADLDD